MTIKEITELIMNQAEEKGFGTKPNNINVSEKIALIHSEVSEADLISISYSDMLLNKLK